MYQVTKRDGSTVPFQLSKIIAAMTRAFEAQGQQAHPEVVELLADEHGWSSSVPNLSGKLRRGSLRYTEAVELADVLGYDLVWQKRREVR